MLGKERDRIIRDRWKALDNSTRFAFVLMSRADRDRAEYKAKVSQIKTSLFRKELFSPV
jgi:hypothetical protein